MLNDLALSMRETDQRRQAFLSWMKAHGLKVPSVARKADVPSSTLYSYVSGKSASLAGSTEARIAQAYTTTVHAIFSGEERSFGVGVFGKIGAKADVYPVNDFESEPMYEVPLPPTVDPEAEYVAFEIDGLSMPPALPGWVAVFRRAEVPVEDLLNSVCMVDLEDGRRLFKRLRRGYEPGRYNLESWDGSPLIENVRIVAALPFAALTPGRSAR